MKNFIVIIIVIIFLSACDKISENENDTPQVSPTQIVEKDTPQVSSTHNAENDTPQVSPTHSAEKDQTMKEGITTPL